MDCLHIAHIYFLLCSLALLWCLAAGGGPLFAFMFKTMGCYITYGCVIVSYLRMIKLLGLATFPKTRKATSYAALMLIYHTNYIQRKPYEDICNLI